MRSGTATGISTPSPLTATSVSAPEDCAPEEAVDDDPYTGTKKAAPTSTALHRNAAPVSQKA